MADVTGPGNGSPECTEFPLNGMYGAIAGNSHRKQTTTTRKFLLQTTTGFSFLDIVLFFIIIAIARLQLFLHNFITARSYSFIHSSSCT